jgi:hypothetical protein
MSYVGYSGVANQAQTTPGCALGVVADASSGDYGADLGGAGVVDTYSCLVPPVPPETCFILMEDSGYVLQEDDSKIYLEVC